MFSLVSTIEGFLTGRPIKRDKKNVIRALKILRNANEGPVVYYFLRRESCGTPKTREIVLVYIYIISSTRGQEKFRRGQKSKK